MRSVRSDDSIIYSITYYCLYHFTAARPSPMIHRTIDSIFANTFRSHRSDWNTAGSHHFHGQGPLNRKSSDLTLRICVLILKCPAANSIILKKLKRKKTFKKFVTLKRHSTNIPSILWNHQNTLLISWDYPFKAFLHIDLNSPRILTLKSPILLLTKKCLLIMPIFFGIAIIVLYI
jgi:hypothetical protein